MHFSLDVVRARKGDCLMLHHGTKKDPRLIMIDGGPSGVYKPHLRPRIVAIRAKRKIADGDPLPVDVLMLSHVDDDHVKGLLELTAELRGQKGDNEPLLVQVGSLWHNSFDDLLNTTPDELKAEAGFGAAALGGTIDVADSAELDVAKVLASIPQGRDLRNDATFLKWSPNHKFKGGLILAAEGSKPVTLDGGLKVTVVGPMKPELSALQKAHDTFLKGKKKKASAESALAAFVDKSIPNLSSIVVLVEADGKRMLLTGDARGDKVLTGLQLTGLLKKGSSSTMHVDVLKVPHHGSANNMETAFFKRVTADHYVFSGDGEHGNPERETLEMLFQARGDAAFSMLFTYPIDEIDVERKKDWEKEQAKEKKKGKKPRPDWSPAKNSLAAFFKKAKLADDQTIVIVPDKTSHLIELLDPVGP